MNKIVVGLVLLLLVAYSALAQEKTELQADAVFQKIIKEYTLQDDGSMDYHCIKQVQLLSYNAIHRLYGETFIVYNPDYQQLIINECYTIMADEKKVVTPANAFNEVLPRNAANAAVFNQLKEMVVTHTALERGSVIYLDYTIKSKKGFYPALMAQEELAEAGPVLSCDIKVKVPDGTALNFRLYHVKAEPTISLEGNKRTYNWHFDTIKAVIQESFQPDNSKFVPSLVFTTARDMNILLSGFTAQSAFTFQFSEKMKAWAQAIQQEKKEELNTILALQEKVTGEFNLYPVPLTNTGFKVRTAGQTWNSAGGTEIEKAVLLVSLLSSLGIQAELAGLFPGYYDIGIGNLLGMSHVYVLVKMKDNFSIMLSVTDLNDQNLLRKKPGSYVSLTARKIYDPIPPASIFNNIKFKGDLKLNKDNELKGKLMLHRAGMENPYFLYQRMPEKVVSAVSDLESSDFTGKKVSIMGEDVSQVETKILKQSFCKQQGNYYFIKWPVAENGLLSWHLGEMVEDRKNPYEIPYAVDESYSYSLRLPNGWQLVNPVEKSEIKNSAGMITVSAQQQKNIVSWDAWITLYESPAMQVSGDYYRNFKELVTRWNTLLSQGSVFKSEE